MSSSVAAFDLDGTLIRNNCSFAFCQFLVERGIFSRTDLLYCSWVYLRHRAGFCSLLSMHQKIFNRLFDGISVPEFELYLPPFLEAKIEPAWYEPAVKRLHQLAASGVHIVLCSSSPALIVRPIAQRLGVNMLYCTEYCVDEENRLSGIDILVDGEKKAAFLKRQGVEHTLAFSDSLLDLPLLEAAQTAVVVRPSRRLKKIAQKRCWEVL